MYIYIYTHNPTTNSGSWSSHFPERCARHVGISNLFLWLQNNRKLKSLIRMLGLNGKTWINLENRVFSVGYFAHPSLTVHRSNRGLAWFCQLVLFTDFILRCIYSLIEIGIPRSLDLSVSSSWLQAWPIPSELLVLVLFSTLKSSKIKSVLVTSREYKSDSSRLPPLNVITHH